MNDFLNMVQWREIMYLLEQGSPPVAVQLLIANCVLLAVWLVQRARNDIRFSERSGIAMTVVMLLTNVFILINGDSAFR